MKHIVNTLLLLVLLVSQASCSNSSDSQVLFDSKCACCHMVNGQSRAPGLIHTGGMTPKSMVASLESGKMQLREPS